MDNEITLFNQPPKINWTKYENQQMWTENAFGYVLPAKEFPDEWAKTIIKSIKEEPILERYEGTPNTLMWLNPQEGVVLITGTYQRFRDAFVPMFNITYC